MRQRNTHTDTSRGRRNNSLATRKVLAYSNHQHFLATAAVAAQRYATSFDWRRHNGHNYVTAIKDQGPCGFCVAFSCVATVEANVRIQKNEPSLDIDVSEADLLFWHGGNCRHDLPVNAALPVFEKCGVCDESVFPIRGTISPTPGARIGRSG